MRWVGVNLQRINRTHNLNDTTVSNPIDFDSYNIKIDTSSVTGTGRSTDVGYPTLYLNGTKSTGGYNVKATQNIPFEIITPSVQTVTVEELLLTAELRSTTSKSLVEMNFLIWILDLNQLPLIRQTTWIRQE